MLGQPACIRPRGANAVFSSADSQMSETSVAARRPIRLLFLFSGAFMTQAPQDRSLGCLFGQAVLGAPFEGVPADIVVSTQGQSRAERDRRLAERLYPRCPQQRSPTHHAPQLFNYFGGTL
jgi:hypothetical protein